MSTPPVLVIVGPTASGKTALGIELARRLGGEVVNADAMQLYRGMDIGTAKATVEERRGVPHHLLDVLDPAEEASVAEFQQLARTAVDDVRSRGRAAIVVGGSGLYVRALLDDLTFPGTDPAVRQRLEAELAQLGAAALHARLAQVDPAAAAALLPTNGRRIVRALEVVEITGEPFTATLPPYGEPRWGAVQLGLDPPTDDLDARIAARVDRMWDDGIVVEAAALAVAGGGLSRTAARALGYAQALAQIAGTMSEEEARAETATATRRLARRQMSWFRRDPRVRWLAHPATVEAALVAAG
ncbi:MAG TPA: tRNA (adenosine(37)-N6)-dimethylallyltransferase MiaA [Mycobacteriales bacterium]|nr:tRNA (adenosine(37)-N6)-dimethylallyltransferase MiaA [Mycobacteriales bacterium]